MHNKQDYSAWLTDVRVQVVPQSIANGLDSLPVPHPSDLGMPHLLLQLEDPIHERFGRGWASRDVDIDRHDPVTTTSNAVTVVVVSASVGTTTHADHPSRNNLVLDHAEMRLGLQTSALASERMISYWTSSV